MLVRKKYITNNLVKTTKIRIPSATAISHSVIIHSNAQNMFKKAVKIKSIIYCSKRNSFITKMS